jgi:hypothetical protein
MDKMGESKMNRGLSPWISETKKLMHLSADSKEEDSAPLSSRRRYPKKLNLSSELSTPKLEDASPIKKKPHRARSHILRRTHFPAKR